MDDAVLEKTARRNGVTLFEDEDPEWDDEPWEPEPIPEPKLGIWAALGLGGLFAERKTGITAAAAATVPTVRRTTAIATGAGITAIVIPTVVSSAGITAMDGTESVHIAVHAGVK